ncbi:MAG: hypothetical protein GY909_00795 [Oligoflexia bacterium]|nr:hypothetical protein [Oligoflexia bacterium]
MGRLFMELGQWAILDIETTGIDPANDSIIDIGFLSFDGTKLEKKFSSLVRYEGDLSYFIQKLTGITNKMVHKAPTWEGIEHDVMELYGYKILAHNSDFEQVFLTHYFDQVQKDIGVDSGDDREEFVDSIPFLSLLFPYKTSLKLENFIVDWGLAEKEEHRGFQDSLDLLKVILIAAGMVKRDPLKYQTINASFNKHEVKGWWFYRFFNLYEDELFEIAEQIDFDLEKHINQAIAFENAETGEVIENYTQEFDLSFSGKNIQAILGNEEKVKEKFPHYRYRKSQVDLSLRVGQCFKNNVHGLVQAPTGTGKTLGYLLPASMFCLEEKKQVLVATGTKTLQQQAMSKDIPQLRKLIGLDNSELKIKRLVGSSNHMCELLFRESMDEEDLLFSGRDFDQRFTDMYFEMLFFHNSRVSEEKAILRDDLPFSFKIKNESFREKEKNLAVDFRACTGNKCPFHQDCSYIRGLREAKDSDIIVGNHSLMFSWPRSFPRPAHVLVDEAHKIEEETTRAFSYEVTSDDLQGLIKTLSNLQGVGSLFYLLSRFEHEPGASTPEITKLRERAYETAQMMKEHLDPLPDQFETYFKKMPRYTDTFWNELPMINGQKVNDQLGQSIFNHLDSLKFIVQNFSSDLLPYVSRWEVKDLEDDQDAIALTRFETFTGQLDDLQVALEVLMENKEGYTHTVKYHEKHGFLLSSSPINVGKMLHDQLLSTSSSVVYTSATLGNAHGDQGIKGVEWATGYSYLEPERRFKSGLFLPAPYDYKKTTRVYVCDDVPGFYQQNFVQDTLKPVIELIKKLHGRTLLLYSAKARFEVAREILLKEFEGKINLYIQGMGANVVEEFKKDEHGILMGMESFGEGIDIPGEKLQFVFIDKIPDLRIDKVINDRRDFYDAHIGNEFTDYYLAHRTRKLHQKLGRLIRREGDIGGVVVVDSRIKKWKGRTMEKLVRMMEPYELKKASLEEACENIYEFIESHSEEESSTDSSYHDQGHLSI